MNLQAIANPDCRSCNGTGVDAGIPCPICAGQRLTRRQERWRFCTRHGMSYDRPDWGAPPDHDEARERMRGSWPLTGRGRVGHG